MQGPYGPSHYPCLSLEIKHNNTQKQELLGMGGSYMLEESVSTLLLAVQLFLRRGPLSFTPSATYSGLGWKGGPGFEWLPPSNPVEEACPH